VGPDGALYAATLPGGKVYRLKADGSAKEDESNAVLIFDLAKAEHGKADIGKAGVVIIDAREDREYTGGTPYGESRGGHVPGAKHVWFKDLISKDGYLLSKEQLAEKLHSTERYPVVDKTGLKGNWDFEFHVAWPPRPDGLSAADALKSQLGLNKSMKRRCLQPSR